MANLYEMLELRKQQKDKFIEEVDFSNSFDLQ